MLWIFDIIGAAAFAVSGAVTGARRKMDIFGVTVLGITTACGGGLMRDLMVGNIPPKMFQNPLFVFIAAVTSVCAFIFLYMHRSMPQKLVHIYDHFLFWCDTLGLAAFTVDGVMVGVEIGYKQNGFLLCALGVLTAVGGGALRDIMAAQTPDIFQKKVYAMAAIGGSMILVLLLNATDNKDLAMAAGFFTVFFLRGLAAAFNWNLPRVQ